MGAKSSLGNFETISEKNNSIHLKDVAVNLKDIKSESNSELFNQNSLTSNDVILNKSEKNINKLGQPNNVKSKGQNLFQMLFSMGGTKNSAPQKLEKLSNPFDTENQLNYLNKQIEIMQKQFDLAEPYKSTTGFKSFEC